MAATKKTTPASADDDLLSLDTAPADQAPAESFDSVVDKPAEETPAPDLTSVKQDDMAAEIARLKAALAAPLPGDEAEDELTPEERELRDLRDQMAQRQALIADRQENVYEDVTGKDTILIHVLQDGFTINGLVTYRGQEFEFPVGGKAYQQTVNREGKSWLRLSDDEQYERWGEARFGHGPWPFKRLSALTLADLPEGSTQADLEAVKRAAERNDRRPPVATV